MTESTEFSKEIIIRNIRKILALQIENKGLEHQTYLNDAKIQTISDDVYSQWQNFPLIIKTFESEKVFMVSIKSGKLFVESLPCLSDNKEEL